MDKTEKNNTENKKDFNLLPLDRGQAMKFLITLSEKLVNITERETQALIQNDVTTFAILQNEKENLSVRYAKASEEFRARLTEFRGVEANLLDRLEILQKQLGDKTKSNMEIVSSMFNRSKKSAERTLLTVQELAQQKPTHLPSQPANGHVNGHVNGSAAGA